MKKILPVNAPKPKTKESMQAAYLYVFILTVLAVSQLFAFDEFTKLFEGFGMPGGVPLAHLSAAFIVVAEVLALPFLLRIKLSPLMRVVSMVLGWLVPLLWLKVSLWLIFTNSRVENLGLLGSKVSLMPGWWSVFVLIAIGLLSAWASWGLWPVIPKKPVKK